MKQEVAGLWKRIMGGWIDLLIVLIISEALIWLFGVETAGSLQRAQITGLPFLIIGIAVLAYYTILEATMGKTLGKMIIRTRVVGVDGEEIGWKKSMIRNVLRIIDGFFFYMPAILVIASTIEKQRFGDMLARTIVVNE